MSIKKPPKEKESFSKKQLVIISIVILALIVSGFLLSTLPQAAEVKFSLKAAIVDQLGTDFPNTTFNETATNFLVSAGFNVSYYPSRDVNVDFFKQLAKYNYGMIILRAHSAIRTGETLVDFFTSEEFSDYRYVSEQDNGLLTKGYYSWKPGEYYFAVTPKFIESLDGTFPKSVIIAMGCNSLNASCTEMAEAFIKKGAKAYIGWTGSVEAAHTDNETTKLLKLLLSENRTISVAVSATSIDYEHYPSKMNFYPQSTEDFRISDLIAEADTSTNQMLRNILEQNFWITTATGAVCLKTKKVFLPYTRLTRQNLVAS